MGRYEAASSLPSIGTTVSHYRILEKLGGGGMGVVYLAEDGVLSRQVALKFLPDALAEDDEALRRFQREARAASALNHPHICVIHELGEDKGRSFIVMELMDGQTLKYLVRGQPMSVDDIARIGGQVADALEAAHGARIIHRDIKPANIFVTAHGEAKVLDFGLAKVTEDQARKVSSGPGAAEAETELAPEQLTSPGTALGTIAYMSPEQVLGEELDERTDLFSLGVVLYEMATGEQPFPGNTTGAVFDQILHRAPTAPIRLNPRLPDELEHILNKALEKDRSLRYQSARDLKADLKRLQRDTTVEPSLTVEAVEPPSVSSRRGLWAGLGAMALAIAVVAGVWLVKGRDGPEEPAEQASAAVVPAAASIAVLPFADMSPEKDQEYFADGLAEELLNVLAQIPELRVAARTSAFSFKGKDVDIATVAEALNVASVLEGSVRKAGSRVRITAQLVNATDGFHLWSQSYDHELDDIFAIQEEIARAVAKSLEVTLLGGGKGGPRARGSNIEAYNAYLQGRYSYYKLSEEDLRKAIGYYEQALDVDPGYALAWAGLAEARLEQTLFGYAEPVEGIPNARQAVQRALELDENLPEGWITLAGIKTWYDWDWVGAEEASQRALALEPGASASLRGAARIASFRGRVEESLELARQAVERDPLNSASQNMLGKASYLAGRLGEAEAAYKKRLELSPGPGFSRVNLGLVYVAQSRPEAALEEMKREGHRAMRVFGLAVVYSALGRQEEADASLQELIEIAQDLGAAQIAECYAFRGETDRAFDWLERAWEQRDSGLSYVKIDPLLENLHGDPRWPVFLEKMGLAE